MYVRIQPVMRFAFIWCRRMIVYYVWTPLHFASRGYNVFSKKENYLMKHTELRHELVLIPGQVSLFI